MVDEVRLKKEYDKIKTERGIRLIPFEKVVKLEMAKLFIREKFLKKITHINQQFAVAFSDPGLSYSLLKEKCAKYFGQLNFEDKREEYGKIILVLAYDYCLIDITFFQNKVKNKMTIFWDS
ncbi:MAG: hypothetical protein MJB14_22370 [Spirochaetes bacterium]|nr:hypothetical protein [Spirochaetota bacterium]